MPKGIRVKKRGRGIAEIYQDEPPRSARQEAWDNILATDYKTAEAKERDIANFNRFFNPKNDVRSIESKFPEHTAEIKPWLSDADYQALTRLIRIVKNGEDIERLKKVYHQLGEMIVIARDQSRGFDMEKKKQLIHEELHHPGSFARYDIEKHTKEFAEQANKSNIPGWLDTALSIVPLATSFIPGVPAVASHLGSVIGHTIHNELHEGHQERNQQILQQNLQKFAHMHGYGITGAAIYARRVKAKSRGRGLYSGTQRYDRLVHRPIPYVPIPSTES